MHGASVSTLTSGGAESGRLLRLVLLESEILLLHVVIVYVLGS